MRRFLCLDQRRALSTLRLCLGSGPGLADEVPTRAHRSDEESRTHGSEHGLIDPLRSPSPEPAGVGVIADTAQSALLERQDVAGLAMRQLRHVKSARA